ncbi:core-2/I-Branching enzyme [Aliiruegeria haliotis]|uniref:Peptide O-xylosyltransferase n=1 Tax=Aliiruegeria haliotis TaxID=1280846 RepID=A0A2T0RRN3_9RHOB|nr:DUF5928 domain-containing protein [Aliiruegeria haliotis]PRY23777.1 core-2/I-Branching enzyme [Aliiruegeria haliotis]
MVQIAYLLLCHKDPDAIIAQARRLTAAGDCVSIHFDGRAPASEDARLREALCDDPNVTFARRRVRCGWGEWSLVEATLQAIEAAMDAFPEATHFYMLSGDCWPVKSAEFAHALLGGDDVDHIESVDYFESGWIKTGFREERLIYRHYFNERKHKRLFYGSYELQKRLGWKRRIPDDLKMMIGSQWWCLRRSTLTKVLDFCHARPEVLRFFSTTWIPDETFFQTIVRHVIPREEIRSRTLTFLMFTDYGVPVTFYNDHYDLLLGQDALFARKISAEAQELKWRLGTLYSATGQEFPISGEGRSLHRFLTGQGRVGERFGKRFWESDGNVGKDHDLLLVVCKKWDVARSLLAAIEACTDIPTAGFLFNDEHAPLPDLGGIEKGLQKRARHRRVLIRMLYGFHGSRSLVICLDPSMRELMEDFRSDRMTTRLLEIECRFNDEELQRHAQQIGLLGEAPGTATRDRVLPALRNDLAFEAERVRLVGFEHHEHIREGGLPAEIALSLSRFLSIPEETARQVAQSADLFGEDKHEG